MSARIDRLRPDHLDALTEIYTPSDQSFERKLLVGAFTAAALLHVVFLFVDLPKPAPRPVAIPEKPEPIPITKLHLDPPPPPEQPPRPVRDTTRLTPIPDPEPDLPEPVIDEPVPIVDDVDEVVPEDVPVIVDDVAPPPIAGPRLPDGHSVTFPVLVADSKVTPEYPALARQARIPGKVILQAVITREGAIGELEVLSCDRPGLGFEEAAIEAVQQWRYEPATQGGRRVEVYFTVVVTFTLH